MLTYRLTSYPTVSWVDSGVMAAAAKTLGIANPPGFPLYMLIGHLFTLIPLGSVVARLQILSHLGAIAALLGVWWLVCQAVEGKWKEWAGLVAVVATAFSYSLWSQAGNVETYTATNGVLMGILVAGLALGRRIEQRGWKKEDKWWVWGLGLIGGLSVGLNPVISALVAPGIWWLVRYKKIVIAQWKVFAVAAVLVVVAGIAIYSYLPIRAAAKPFVDWGDPVNWERIQKHLVGEGLDIYEPETNSINGFTGQPKVWWESFWHFWELAVWQFTPLLFPLVIWGGWLLAKKRQDIFWPLILLVLVNLTYVVLYYGGNQESWMMTSWLVAGVMLGVGVGETSYKLQATSNKLTKVVLILVALIPLWFWWPKVNHAKYTFADDFARNIYREVPVGAVIIGGGDFFHAVSLYNREVTGLRADIIPVTGNMFYIFDWYREGLRKNTDLVISPELEALIKFKSAEEFTQIIDRLIADNPKKQFFVTPLLLRDTVVAGHKEGNYHTQNYDLVPHGLVLKVVAKGAREEPIAEIYDFGITYPELLKDEQPLYLERNYKNAYKLLRNDYAGAFRDLGEYLEKQGKADLAEKYYQKAVEWGPKDNLEYWNRLAIFYAQNGRVEEARQSFEQAKLIDPDNEGLKQNWEMFLQQTSQPASESAQVAKTADVELPDGWQKYSGGGLTFGYPLDWQKEKQGQTVTITEVGSGFSMAIKKLSKAPLAPIEEFMAKQTQTYGQLINQGLAKIPGTDYAYVRVWSDQTGSKMQFFMFYPTGVVEIVVGPTDNQEMMRQFDQIVSSLRVDE